MAPCDATHIDSYMAPIYIKPQTRKPDTHILHIEINTAFLQSLQGICSSSAMILHFAVYNINGDCSVLISAKSDDIFVKTGWLEEKFREVNKGISYAAAVFCQNIVFNCVYQDEYDEEGYTKYIIDHAANVYYDVFKGEVYPLENLTSDEKKELGLS